MAGGGKLEQIPPARDEGQSSVNAMSELLLANSRQQKTLHLGIPEEADSGAARLVANLPASLCGKPPCPDRQVVARANALLLMQGASYNEGYVKEFKDELR